MRAPADTVAVVTGANTGLGRATAEALAAAGSTVVLACRSEGSTVPVIHEITAATGNDRVSFLRLDLADLAQVRSAAAELLAVDRPIHLLVNNAGVAGQRGLTKDGFELAFGTNHLGHFLFTRLLEERLVASGPARVVNVSSGNHFQVGGIDWNAVRRPTATFVGLHEYGVSKLANVLFTQELARHHDPEVLSTFAVNPGPVATDVWRRMPGPVYAAFQFARRMKSPADGARPTLFAATEPGIEARSGSYLDDDCSWRAPSMVTTADFGRVLWERSQAWVDACA